MKLARVCALLVLKDGKIVLEKYAPARRKLCVEEESSEKHNGPDREYGIASVAKSITSTLVGAAIAKRYHARTRTDFEAAVAMTADQVIPRLGSSQSGKGYQSVSIARVLNMRSGVKWDDSKGSQNTSDFDRLVKVERTRSIVDFAMHYRKRGWGYAKAFNYSMLDASINGAVAEAMMRTSLATYVKQTFWQKLGMAARGRWAIDNKNLPIGACCFYLRLHDLARFGLFVLNRGKTHRNVQLIPSAWFDLATEHASDDRIPYFNASYIRGCPLDYHFQWWLRRRPATDFTAIGIAGQFVHIYPKEHAVVVQISDWGYWHSGDARTCMTMLAHDALVKAAGQ